MIQFSRLSQQRLRGRQPRNRSATPTLSRDSLSELSTAESTLTSTLLRYQILTEPFSYLASVPGKEVRSGLMEAFNLWMRVDPADLGVVKEVVGMLHTASLL